MIDMTEPKKYTSLSVLPETREFIRAEADKRGMRINCLVDRALKEYCKKNRA